MIYKKPLAVFLIFCTAFYFSLKAQDTLILKSKSEIHLENFVKGFTMPSLYLSQGQFYILCNGPNRLFSLNTKFHLNEMVLPSSVKDMIINDAFIANEKEQVFLDYHQIVACSGKESKKKNMDSHGNFFSYEAKKSYLKKGMDGNRSFACFSDKIVLREILDGGGFDDPVISSDSIMKLKLYSVTEKTISKTITLPFHFKGLNYFNNRNYFARNSNFVLLTSMAKPEYHLVSSDLNTVTSYFENDMKGQPGVSEEEMKKRNELNETEHDPLNIFGPIKTQYLVHNKYTCNMGAVFTSDSTFINSYRYRDVNDTTIHYEKLFFYKISKGGAKIIKTGSCVFRSGVGYNDNPEFMNTFNIASDGKRFYQLKTKFNGEQEQPQYYLLEFEIR